MHDIRGGRRRPLPRSARPWLVLVAAVAMMTVSVPVAQAASQAKLSFERSSPSTLTVKGSGFAQSAPVKIDAQLDRCRGTSAARTNSKGSFSAELEVRDTCAGLASIRASAQGTSARGTFRFAKAPAERETSGTVEASNTTRVAWVTGQKSPNRTKSRFGVTGTDLGVMWERGDGEVLVAFGDSFGGAWTGHGTARGRDDWRRNWVVTSDTRNLNEGLELTAINAKNNRVPELLHAERGEVTVIPTTGIAYKGKQYMHYMAVTRWGAPGRWNTSHSGVAVSDDGGVTWDRGEDNRIPNDGGDNPFQLLAYNYGPDNKLYGFGTPNGRAGDIHLARIDGAPSDIDSWVYWDGSQWTNDSDDAKAVAKGPAGEPSVGWHRGLGKWVMLYLDEKQAAIVMRTAPKASGPWSDTEVVVSAKDYPGLYGAFIHPASLKTNSNDLFFTMSQWGPYNVMLMKTRLSAS